jgi:ABC-type phosphate/phosphonate transport system substrate-binding protein
MQPLDPHVQAQLQAQIQTLLQGQINSGQLHNTAAIQTQANQAAIVFLQQHIQAQQQAQQQLQQRSAVSTAGWRAGWV